MIHCILMIKLWDGERMTEKRYFLLYGVDENPYEWDIIDNEKNSIIYQSNGIAICKELNDLHEENQELKRLILLICLIGLWEEDD